MYEYAAQLVRVVDGDTVRLDLDLGFYERRVDQPYRLLRINAPELNTVDGKVSKAALETFLAGKALMAHTQKSDSFGRFLTELYADNQNVSDWLVANGFAAYKVY
jgi:micrococcal nuclease